MNRPAKFRLYRRKPTAGAYQLSTLKDPGEIYCLPILKLSGKLTHRRNLNIPTKLVPYRFLNSPGRNYPLSALKLTAGFSSLPKIRSTRRVYTIFSH